jgi:adenylosuccinate lyase
VADDGGVGGVHVMDSAVYGHLWSTPEMREWFADAGRQRTWLQILAALAEAQAGLGLVPAHVPPALRDPALAGRLDVAAVAEQTRATGHSTLGLIRCLREVLPADVREWVYYGATVQDLTDTWTALTMRHTGDLLDRELARLCRAALALAERHRLTVMPGRTHGQPGLPITFGFKVAVWADELVRHRERLAQGRARWEVAQLGGALGTMEFWGPAAPALLHAFAERLGLGTPRTPWLTARDGVAEFMTLLALVTGTLAKIGNEIYELQRPELGEVREPAVDGVVGSITMPHKRNPELSEHLDTLARVVRADAAVAVEGVVAQHERDGRAWKAEWAVLPEACALTATALRFGGALLEGLQVDPERMAANVAAHRGYLLSEPVMRALADRLGKHVAQEVVHAAAMRGLDAGLSLRAALESDPTVSAHLGPDDLDALLDPSRALGAAPAFVDAVLELREDR